MSIGGHYIFLHFWDNNLDFDFVVSRCLEGPAVGVKLVSKLFKNLRIISNQCHYAALHSY